MIRFGLEWLHFFCGFSVRGCRECRHPLDRPDAVVANALRLVGVMWVALDSGLNRDT